MAQFALEDVSFTYPGGETPSLRHINLTLEPGEFVLLCGRSGCGKTTLLRHLKSMLCPFGKREGRVLFEGKPLEEVSLRLQAERIGFVMQNPEEQIVTDKVWHELAFGLENLGCSQKTMRLRVAEMASFFGIQDWFHRDVAELSGGQKQLLNLASVMAMQPDILILDEPTSQLDPIAASDFLNTLHKINRELGTTILLTEHRTEDVFPYADRVVVMENGCITADDSPRSVGARLFREGNSLSGMLPTPSRVFYAVGGEGESPLTVREGRRWLCSAFAEKAPKVTCLPPEPPVPENGEAALELKGIWFRYEQDSPDILRELSLRVPSGSLFAIVGGNGTGKSTTLKVLCGVYRHYRGSISILGKDSRKYRPGELFRGVLAMLPQDPKSLFVRQTLGADLMEMTRDKAEVARVAELCEVSHLLSAHPSDLSGGEQQRGALAKVLLTKPRLLLLDEPTKGLDSVFKSKFAAMLAKLQQQGVTIVMVSHDVEFCAEYADYVSMFFDGTILTTDTPRRFFGSNSFYTTAANRMSRSLFSDAVTVGDVAALYQQNREAL